MIGRTDSRRRLLVVLVVFVVTGAGLTARLACWQVVQQPMLAARAQDQTLTQVSIPSRRGTIYDRSGTVVLATTVDRYMLEANPNLLGANAADRTQLASDLIGIIGLAPIDAAAFSQKINSNRPYVDPRPRPGPADGRPAPGRDRCRRCRRGRRPGDRAGPGLAAGRRRPEDVAGGPAARLRQPRRRRPVRRRAVLPGHPGGPTEGGPCRPLDHRPAVDRHGPGRSTRARPARTSP